MYIYISNVIYFIPIFRHNPQSKPCRIREIRIFNRSIRRACPSLKRHYASLMFRIAVCTRNCRAIGLSTLPNCGLSWDGNYFVVFVFAWQLSEDTNITLNHTKRDPTTSSCHPSNIYMK